MDKQPPKRKPGRPALGKRGNFTFRVREALREQLIAAAESSKLSVSEEIERRLEASFTTIGVVAEMFGGRENAQLLFMFSVAMREVERKFGNPWWTDQLTCEALRKAVDKILLAHKAHLPSWKTAEGDFPPLADMGRRVGFPFIDYFQIGDAAALAMAKAQLAVRNAPVKAPETPPPSKSSSRKAKGK
jgi:hypothetical protein